MRRQWLTLALASAAMAELPPGALELTPAVPLLLPVYIGDAPLVVPLPLPLIVEDDLPSLQRHLDAFCATHGLPRQRCEVVYDALTTTSWSTDEKAVVLVVNDLSWQWVDLPAESLAGRICHYVAVQANHPHVLDPTMCLTTLELAFARTEAWKLLRKAGLTLPLTTEAETAVVEDHIVETVDSLSLEAAAPEIVAANFTMSMHASDDAIRSDLDTMEYKIDTDSSGSVEKVEAVDNDDFLEVVPADDDAVDPSIADAPMALLAAPVLDVPHAEGPSEPQTMIAIHTSPDLPSATVEGIVADGASDTCVEGDVLKLADSVAVDDAIEGPSLDAADVVSPEPTTPLFLLPTVPGTEAIVVDAESISKEAAAAPGTLERLVSSGRYMPPAVSERTRGNLTRSMAQCGVELLAAVDSEVLVVPVDPAAALVLDAKHVSCPVKAPASSPVVVVVWAVVLSIIAVLWRRNLLANAQLEVCAAEIARLQAAAADAADASRADKDALAAAQREPAALRTQLAQATARLADLQLQHAAQNADHRAQVAVLDATIAELSALVARQEESLLVRPAPEPCTPSDPSQSTSLEPTEPSLPELVEPSPVLMHSLEATAGRIAIQRQSSSLLDTVIASQEAGRPKHSRFSTAARSIALGWSLVHRPTLPVAAAATNAADAATAA
ncbi:hypothetical protein ACHHYP_00149 [Achlya hypogyna]|uniref:Secreted protein n=1 Tax=Achlya hypogyna TaxID=1202772 RepID=A0A1V9ZBR0_ACHHY|nr:hypothetical protein ACHHYP_00149 [Achlya hypogyna]